MKMQVQRSQGLDRPTNGKGTAGSKTSLELFLGIQIEVLGWDFCVPDIEEWDR